MIVQVNTDGNVHGKESLNHWVESMLQDALERFHKQITRVEVHLTDENSDKKGGGNDKRCVLEVRLAGLQPIAVRDQADTVEKALDGAVDKAIRSIEHTLDKRERH